MDDLVAIGLGQQANTFMFTSNTDDILTIVSDGYFDGAVDTKSPLASQLKQGDIIICRGSSFDVQTVGVSSPTGTIPLTVV